MKNDVLYVTVVFGVGTLAAFHHRCSQKAPQGFVLDTLACNGCRVMATYRANRMVSKQMVRKLFRGVRLSVVTARSHFGKLSKQLKKDFRNLYEDQA